jgi:hypothetical protein
MSVSSEGASVSYASDIKPLFRESDREAMESHFDLWSYGDVSSAADRILSKLEDGTMPCDGAWPGERVELFRSWVEEGKPA